MDINHMIQSWMNVLTRPSEQTFEVERQHPNANLTTALIWMAIAAVVAGVLALIQGMIFSASLAAAGGMSAMFAQMDLPPESLEMIDALPFLGGPAVGVGAAIWSIVGTLIAFLIGTGFFFLVARLLGGTGNFGRYAYLIAAFSAPLSILSALLGFVPVLGGCLGFIVAIYQMVLTYFATKVEHNLSQGRAIVVVLIPVILVILLAFCLIFFAASLIFTMSSGG